MKNNDLPPICGFESAINELVNRERDSRQFKEKSDLKNVPHLKIRFNNGSHNNAAEGGKAGAGGFGEAEWTATPPSVGIRA